MIWLSDGTGATERCYRHSARDRALLRAHRETYRRFWQWSDAAVDQAMPTIGEVPSTFVPKSWQHSGDIRLKPIERCSATCSTPVNLTFLASRPAAGDGVRTCFGVPSKPAVVGDA